MPPKVSLLPLKLKITVFKATERDGLDIEMREQHILTWKGKMFQVHSALARRRIEFYEPIEKLVDHSTNVGIESSGS